ncbi:aspartyl-tRNA(Asn)/glutamyl-tRNA(Gln) amidotransferase subunit C [Scopulibacillus daqui]|uniref:Aspartyl/glutamyl-tRNA(Asn/Gln) amidotransferase subunit C n=1 Tax=Scopulibacillus daqui TaxID=1469162 RepID=A0ABS2Q3T4_9BACL|nr:Asp-tRNA(Asn)/Glu-tRNA(Gln) amidotransferase subunit GatC [Scopulibacillus daqui]MBM7646962.1 aspartyl-tRNA(Asn)/glutamyl-tRNA(Gln) amidotransferase subunit C [Scopulibacillus daqui]
MGQKITKEQVKHVANLARLSFTEEEVETFTNQLGDIIDFAEQLNELDTSSVEPTTHVLDISNVLREDVSRDWLTREEALKNAPEQQGGQVKVPAVLEQE